MDVASARAALASLQRQRHAYSHALGMLYLDGVTHAPSAGAEYRGETLGVLSAAEYRLFVCPETQEMLALLRETAGALTQEEIRQTELLTREYENISKIPEAEYVAFQKLINRAESVWHEAKPGSDFAAFAPCLEEIRDTLVRFAGYYKPGAHPYDVWLDQFERGLTMEKLDAFFARLRARLVPLLRRVVAEGAIVNDGFLRDGRFPKARQQALSDRLMEILRLDRSRCAIDETEHPFTIEFNNRDVRITTHYHEDDLRKSMYSVIHEGGHALYELGIADEYMFTCLGGGVSMGIHESQSRLFETQIGQSRAFTDLILPEIKALFPQLSGVSEEAFYRAVNKAEPSLVRTEADELTYCLHIMVRYEIEKMLMEKTVPIRDVPAVWNRLMREYLGVCVPDDRRGALQDSHWSGGSIGYFPSYALGNAYAAQIMRRMKKDVDVDKAVRVGDLSPVVSWLTAHIYRFGSMFDPGELFERCCGEAFDPDCYLDYLTEKYSAIYGLV